MARQTIAQLSVELESIRTYCAVLEQKLAASQEEVAALKAAKPQRATRPAYVPSAPSAEQLATRERMAAAKALAMATGRVVRV